MKGINFKIIFSIICKVILVYLVYVILTGVILFFFRPKSNDINKELIQFESKEFSNDKVALVEEGYDGYLARVDLIKNANESIDMAYYKIGNDYTTDVVLGSLINAANRGVKVRFVLDRMFMGIGSDFNETLYAFE